MPDTKTQKPSCTPMIKAPRPMGDKHGEKAWLGIMCATVKICAKRCDPHQFGEYFTVGIRLSESGRGGGFGMERTAQAKARRQRVGHRSVCSNMFILGIA